jgi:hypothetical protein
MDHLLTGGEVFDRLGFIHLSLAMFDLCLQLSGEVARQKIKRRVHYFVLFSVEMTVGVLVGDVDRSLWRGTASYGSMVRLFHNRPRRESSKDD